ncbi:M16 family metallopeptidase [Lutibaculum baratangense]|uniref:Mitochondrial processing peptidase-like protein n=1 Tax=Lutibaculum baratangense AMV1 TaxID=631454 RepID=V4RFL1_9HYPH|nr:pitrilysin family protein [Lutibaculum baratangense]ESR24931.1 hypothetical protein N177_2254 [Lutibaculum baratangense AMV1]
MTVDISILPNGLKVVTERMPQLETAALGVWVRAGARDERPEENGLSHLLEHMAFKGTKRRSARMIAEEIEQVGGDLNAATSHEMTAYYARVLADDVPLGLDILADILRESQFDEAELKREKQVILQELGAALDDPEDLVHELLQEAAFPQQAIGRSILGTRDTVPAQSREALFGYLGRFYRGRSLVVAAAGAVDHDAIVRQVEGLFGDLPAEPREPVVPASFRGGERRAEKDLSEANLLLAFEGPSFLDEKFYAARIAAGVLGGGMSSRLFQRLREEMGLCYAIYAFTFAYSDTGLFGLSAATSEDCVKPLIDAAAEEIVRAAEEVDEAETARARAQMKAGLLMSLESCSARAERIARQTLFLGQPMALDEMVARIDAVDAASVRAAIATAFTGSAPALSAVGPIHELESAERIARKLASAAPRAA